jgi:hypothetical protein
MADLHVFAVYDNPQRSRSRLQNFQRFETGVLAAGAVLTTVELVQGNYPYDLPLRAGVTRVRRPARDILWHKENALDIASANTPGWEYAAWIDGDIVFADLSWVRNTINALQMYRMVQISSELVFLGPKGQHVSKGTSIMQLYEQMLDGGDIPPDGPYGPVPIELKGHGYPGGAWAYRREAWDALGGLLDRCIVGAADHHMAQGLLNIKQTGEPADLSPAYAAYLAAWKTNALNKIERDVGMVPGVAMHYWHGPYSNRKYESRWTILRDNAFDPNADVVYDGNGVLQFAGNKPQLMQQIRRYFLSRNEDTLDL